MWCCLYHLAQSFSWWKCQNSWTRRPVPSEGSGYCALYIPVGTAGKNWITGFLDRQPALVAKVSAAFNKKRIKTSDPKVLINHFRKLRGLIRKFKLPEDMWFNLEKGFVMGKSGRCKLIRERRGRAMTGKLAQDGNRELITVIDIVCGIMTVLAPLVT